MSNESINSLETPKSAEQIPEGYVDFSSLGEFAKSAPSTLHLPMEKRGALATRLWNGLNRISRVEYDNHYGLEKGYVTVRNAFSVSDETPKLEMFLYAVRDPHYQHVAYLNVDTFIRVFGPGDAHLYFPNIGEKTSRLGQEYSMYMSGELEVEPYKESQTRLSKLGKVITYLAQKIRK